MVTINKNEIFKSIFINSMKMDNVCKHYGIKLNKLREIKKELKISNEIEIENIRRIRVLYNNKRKIEKFEFVNFESFYLWHKKQYSIQKGCCYYCKTPEKTISEVAETFYKHRKRKKRGIHLEIERKDPFNNIYDSNNCVLACYFCNNDKSDIFKENEYFDYLNNRKVFFELQLKKIQDRKH